MCQAAGLDGTDLPAWSSRDPHDTRRGLGDPDARLGRGKKGFLLGYLSLFLVDIEGFPLGHHEAPRNVNEKQLVEALLTRVLGECIEVELLAADKPHGNTTERLAHALWTEAWSKGDVGINIHCNTRPDSLIYQWINVGNPKTRDRLHEMAEAFGVTTIVSDTPFREDAPRARADANSHASHSLSKFTTKHARATLICLNLIILFEVAHVFSKQ